MTVKKEEGRGCVEDVMCTKREAVLVVISLRFNAALRWRTPVQINSDIAVAVKKLISCSTMRDRTIKRPDEGSLGLPTSWRKLDHVMDVFLPKLVELSTASKSNIEILQRFQNKYLRIIISQRKRH